MLQFQRPWVKICGLAREEDIHACHALGADAVGLIVVPNTHPHRNKDQLLLEEAASLVQQKISSLQYVILTHSKNSEEILHINKIVKPDYIQLQSDVRGIESLYEYIIAGDIKFIKKVSIVPNSGTEHLSQIVSEYEIHRFYSILLLDSASAAGGKGGTGKVHDWNLSAQLIGSFPKLKFVLAGGLTPDNVGNALERVRPWGLDVMTGVSSERGVKDSSKIAAFISKIDEYSSSGR
ncbi:phosphoribosylanthranilate isomerase [Bosea sp. NPDC055332]